MWWRAVRFRVWGVALAVLTALSCVQPSPPAHPELLGTEELGQAFVGRSPAPEPTLVVPLLALRVADDDGKRAARVGPEQVAAWVAYANQVFRPAGVQLLFERGAFRELRSTRINGLQGTGQVDWREVKRTADEVASFYPDRLVVFFRHGPGNSATGVGMSWTDYNFVLMPGWFDDAHCGHDHIYSLAHEIGHHLGLPHTFARVFSQPAEAAAFLRDRNGDVRAFDGDGLRDTAPDPGIRTTECGKLSELSLSGVRVPLVRRNVMSYYEHVDSLSAQQIQRLRWFLNERRAYQMKLPKNDAPGALEAEELEVLASQGGRCSTQQMDAFGGGNWSNGRQLFCYSNGQLWVRVRLPSSSSGWQRLDLYLTRAPDFGILEVLLDGRPIGTAYDAWAPAVLASGAIHFGEHQLAAGDHELSFVVRAKNLASEGFHIGIDAVALVSVAQRPAQTRVKRSQPEVHPQLIVLGEVGRVGGEAVALAREQRGAPLAGLRGLPEEGAEAAALR
jgi:hypothetical protein